MTFLILTLPQLSVNFLQDRGSEWSLFDYWYWKRAVGAVLPGRTVLQQVSTTAKE